MLTIEPTSPLSADLLVEFLKAKYPDVKSIGTPPDSIKSVCPVDSSEADNNSLSFIRTKDSHQINKTIANSKSGSFFVSSDTTAFIPPAAKWVLLVPDPQVAYVRVLEKFFLDREEHLLPKGIHPTAIIDPLAQVADDVRIGAYVVIGANCIIESGVTIHPHVVLYNNVKVKSASTLHSHAIIREHCIIGINCTIQPGAVVGSDGFGYVQDPEIGLRTVPQVGNVELFKNVDVGSNSCIDRAAHGVTKIGMGTKIDNLVQIGHNVDIGSHSVICGQVGIGGSSKIGDGVVLGGQVGVGDHMTISSGVRVGGAGVVISNVEEPGDYMGYPVQHAFKWRRILAAQLALPDLLKSFRKKKET